MMGALLSRLVVLARELQADAGTAPFKLPVRFVSDYLQIGDNTRASGLLRTLEYRGILHCVRRGTATKGDVPGVPTLWRLLKEPAPYRSE
jgi:hypothetical protein